MKFITKNYLYALCVVPLILTTFQPANALEVPKNDIECFVMIKTIGATVRKLKLPAEQEAKLMPMGAEIQKHCAAKKYTEAFTVYQKLETALAATQK